MMPCGVCRSARPSCSACAKRCQVCGDPGCSVAEHPRFGRNQRPIWYAVAYDIAGGIAAWSGPWSWSRARIAARKLEQPDTVRDSRVTRWMPTLHVGCQIAGM